MSRSDRLAGLYDAHAPRVYGYCLRHVGVHDADDMLAETFAVAWRRLDSVPDEPLPWLVAVARNLIRNHRRGTARRRELLDRLRDVQSFAAHGPESVVVDREQMLAALAGLSEKEREALLLVAWDGLEPRSAAPLAGCSLRAFRARVTRARAHLEAALGTDPRPVPEEDRYVR